MHILGIVGSPHRDGLTNRLVQSALEGAREGGAHTETLYAIDYGLDYCRSCQGRPCWETGDCQFGPEARQVSERMLAADGLILGAPVYFWQVNALTAGLMDRTRLTGRLAIWTRGEGRPALGISIAGGTGTGLVAAVQSLYKYLQIYGFRALEPLPACRFNFEQALERARQQGRTMAGTPAQPFADLGESLAWYDALPFLRWGTLEEIHYLARLIEENLTESESNRDLFETLRRERAEAQRRLAAGDRAGACHHAAAAYLAGREAWERG